METSQYWISKKKPELPLQMKNKENLQSSQDVSIYTVHLRQESTP